MRVKHVLTQHPEFGPGVYKNQAANNPYDGDFILEYFGGGQVFRLWYYVDNQSKVVNVVTVWSQPFGLM